MFTSTTTVKMLAHACVLCLILNCSLSVASVLRNKDVKVDFTFPDQRQENFMKRLTEFHIDYPTKVDEDGIFKSFELHHELKAGSRVKRDISDDLHTVHYKVNVDDQDLHLDLKPNYKFLAPGVIVERRTEGHGNISSAHITQRNYNKCHFIGEVKGHPGSKVAMTTCNGLTGLVRLPHTEYFIEPVKGHDLKSSPHHPHVIYKRSAIPPELSGLHKDDKREGTCGVSDEEEDADKEREKWQKNANVQSSSSKHHRVKRSMSLERNVETLVVVDKSMMEFYKNEDIETYVLTIMNMVANMYHDSTIGNAVNIVLVRLLFLEKDEKDLVITHHADNTLESFCKYQNSINTKDDKHPNHHDVGVLLTRHNICSRMNEPCSTLGLSQVSGMCQPHRSCNINEDTGLVLAYTVAHEIGHNFGMQHDNFKSGCEARSGEVQHVMSPQLTADSSPLIWSNCSRSAITKFLDRDWGYCLNDEPSEHDFWFPVLPPGVMYDVNHQCRLVYGHESEFCDGIDDVCSTLWCKVDNKCMSRMEAAAQGSLCGDNKWCFAGKCVTIGERSAAIDGQWGQWGGWSECSRTCGAGVQYDERMCNNPPPSNGGKYCLGERKRYKICRTDQCPEDQPSFRQQQCAEFNYIPYKNMLHEWEPVNTPLTPCQLHCKPKNLFFSAMLRDIVADGTPCRLGKRDICISGNCRHVGCDWVIDSDAREDRCGVCRGDGSTCTTVNAEFKEEQGRGYVEAMVIPEGARNIRVEEVAEANNYLAIRNNDGQFYLNGDWFIQWSGDYEAAGTIIHYKRDRNKESFISPGPIKEPLHVMLLFQSQNPGVHIEYTVPMDNATEQRPRVYVWRLQDWSHCTASCGGGWQRSRVVCEEMEDGRVDDSYCDPSTKPNDQQKTCNEHMCPARWWKGPWQHCSVTCGSGGVRRRTVICIRSQGPDEQIALEDDQCDGVERPSDTEPCHHKEPCTSQAYWKVGEWSDTCHGNPCSKQTRHVTCSDRNAICDLKEKPETERLCMAVTCGTWQTLDWQGKCNGDPCTNLTRKVFCNTTFCSEDEKPASVRQCENITCGTWYAAEWSQCTRSCGGGVQQRLVTCEMGEACALSQEPPSQQMCNVHPCHSFDRDTTTTQITGDIDNTVPLFNPAGENYEESNRYNHQNYFTEPPESDFNHHFGNSIQFDEPAADEKLHPASDKENKNSPQNLHSSKESREKELGILSHGKTRHHKHNHHSPTGVKHTQNMAKNNSLTISGKDYLVPQVQERDIYEMYYWNALPWTECPVFCGGGLRTRDITCIDRDTLKEVPPEKCEGLPAPETEEECNMYECLEWTVSQWSQCSASCGEGLQHRQISCPIPDHCLPSKRPPDEQPCTSVFCMQWVSGPWSQCSKTCGGGEQLRMIQCLDPITQKTAEGCDMETRPIDAMDCNTMPCPETSGNAALAGPASESVCRGNTMSNTMCHALKRKGRCNLPYIRSKCCRTCHET